MEHIQFLIVHFAIILLTSQIHIGLTQIGATRIAAFNAGGANFKIRKIPEGG
jgi:hypothetical protein